MDVHDLGDRDDLHGAGLSVVPVGDTGLLLLGIPLNAAILMKFAPMGPFMTELYPTDIRGTGQGFCYNAGRAIGSVFMTAIGFATAVMPLGTRDRGCFRRSPTC